MTPPKKKPIKIREVSKDFKSKPTQIVCSQSSRSHNAAITSYEIGKRLANTTIMPRINKVKEAKKRLKEKEK